MSGPGPADARLARGLAGGALFVGLALTSFASSCSDPELSVGDWTCTRATLEQANGEAGASSHDVPIEVPWSTSFEDGFCGYRGVRGYCYADADATDASLDAWYRVSSLHTHTGKLAAAFRIDTSGDGQQARCLRQGVLPEKAYYGAWFYIPEGVQSASNWNLMHFRGGDDEHGLWDVSIERGANGALSLFVYDFLHITKRPREGTAQVPIGKWFRVVFYLQRAADATGEFALFQDGEQVLRRQNIATDDSSWGEWYCGNFARALTPPDATIYVDDVTIDTKL